MSTLRRKPDLNQTDQDEVALVRRAQIGDLRAFEKLLRLVHPRIRAYVSGLVSPVDVEDVLQDISLKLFQELSLLREPQAFHAWVYRIATRTALRQSKRDKRWDAHERDPAILDTIAEPEHPPQWEVDASFLNMLNAVAPASRAVLLLHYQQDLSLPHVAAVLDIPLGTAKSRLSYGIATLRKLKKENKYAF